MAGLADLSNQAVLAGLKDDSYAQAKAAQQQQIAQDKAAAQHKALQEFILGKQQENKIAEDQAKRSAQKQDLMDYFGVKTPEEAYAAARKDGTKSVHIGDMTISAATPPDPLSSYLKQQTVGKNELDKYNKDATKAASGYQGYLESNRTFRDLLSNPNKYTGDAAAVQLAKMDVGPGQRMPIAVMQSFKPERMGTLTAALAKLHNFVTSGVEPKLSPDELAAMQNMGDVITRSKMTSYQDFKKSHLEHAAHNRGITRLDERSQAINDAFAPVDKEYEYFNSQQLPSPSQQSAQSDGWNQAKEARRQELLRKAQVK